MIAELCEGRLASVLEMIVFSNKLKRAPLAWRSCVFSMNYTGMIGEYFLYKNIGVDDRYVYKMQITNTSFAFEGRLKDLFDKLLFTSSLFV